MPKLFRLPTTKPTPPAVAPKMFPPDPARINTYDLYENLWKGNHAAIFSGEWVSRYRSHVISNIPANIVSLQADLLFGEELEFNFDEGTSDEAEQIIRDIWERNDMRLALYEASTDGARCGDAVFTVERDQDELARVRGLSARTWFPTLNPDDVRDVIRHEIAWKRNDGKQDYLRVIRHERGTIFNELFMLRGSEVGAPASDAAWELLYPLGRPEKEIDTLVDDFLVVHIPNARGINDYFGRSVFVGTLPLFEAVDARLTQGNAILSRHANPILGLPETVFTSTRKQGVLGQRLSMHMPDSSGEPGIDPAKLDVVSLGPNGEAPQYITWDGRIEDILAYVDKIVEQIALVSETAPQLLNRGDFGQAISGRALKILLLRTLAKVNRTRRYYDVGIQKLMELAQLVEGVEEPATFSIKWPDGLPQDIAEAVETEARKLEVGIQSKKGAIAAVDDVDSEAAEKKLKEIQEEDDANRNNPGLANAVHGGSPNRQPIQVNFGGQTATAATE